jgi:hypothetical protein
MQHVSGEEIFAFLRQYGGCLATLGEKHSTIIALYSKTRDGLVVTSFDAPHTYTCKLIPDTSLARGKHRLVMREEDNWVHGSPEQRNEWLNERQLNMEVEERLEPLDENIKDEVRDRVRVLCKKIMRYEKELWKVIAEYDHEYVSERLERSPLRRYMEYLSR